MKPRTTKEVEAERQQRRFGQRKAQAKQALELIHSTSKRLQLFAKQANAVKALQEHAAWLIEEDEAYEAAAAELYIQQAEQDGWVAQTTDGECLDR